MEKLVTFALVILVCGKFGRCVVQFVGMERILGQEILKYPRDILYPQNSFFYVNQHLNRIYTLRHIHPLSYCLKFMQYAGEISFMNYSTTVIPQVRSHLISKREHNEGFCWMQNLMTGSYKKCWLLMAQSKNTGRT